MLKLKIPFFLNRYNTKGSKRKFLGLAVILLLTLVGLTGWYFINNKLEDQGKLYAQAAGHKIYENEVRDLLGKHNPNISDSEAATVLADKYLIESLAKERGLNISDDELEREYGKQTLKQRETNKYAYQNKLNQLYFTKLATYNRGVYKGRLLVTHFSRNVAYQSPLLKEEKRNNPDLGKPAAIAKDRKYAEDLINRLHKDIKSGRLGFEDAIKIENKDPRVGLSSNYKTLLHSGSFDTTVRPNGLIETASIRKRISEIKPGELTEPFVVRVSNSLEDESTAESYFLVIQMDEVSKGVNMPFDQYLEEAKTRLEYRVYV